jgi:hypothetical protein
MEQANANRTTHATVANDTSSRSHAICQVSIFLFRYKLRKEIKNFVVSSFLLILLEVKELKILKVIIAKGEWRVQKSTKGKIYMT